jgi:hypothetical protein
LLALKDQQVQLVLKVLKVHKVVEDQQVFQVLKV